MNEQQILDDLKTRYISDVAREHRITGRQVYSVWAKHNPGKRLDRRRVPREVRIKTFGGDAKRNTQLVRLVEALKEKKTKWKDITAMTGITRERYRQLRQLEVTP